MRKPLLLMCAVMALLVPVALAQETTEEPPAAEVTPGAVVTLPPSDAIPPGQVLLRLAHFAPDAGTVDIYLNGDLSAIQEIGFPQVSDYITAPEGNYDIAVVPSGEPVDAAVFESSNVMLSGQTGVTLTATGLVEDETFSVGMVGDNLSALDPNNARLTILHAVADGPVVDILQGTQPVIENVAFGGVVTVDVPAGSYDLQIVPTGEVEPAIIDLRGTEFTANTYTLIAVVGDAESPQVVVEEIPLDSLAEATPEADAAATEDGDATAPELPPAETLPEATPEATPSV